MADLPRTQVCSILNVWGRGKGKHQSYGGEVTELWEQRGEERPMGTLQAPTL